MRDWLQLMEYIALSQILGATALSTLIIGGILFFLRNSITSWIWKEHSIEIEKAKNELLNTTEYLKFDFQKDAMKLQILNSSLFVIYPKLNKKIKIAQGCVGGLYGFRYSKSWEGFNSKDFDEVLVEKNIPHGKRGELIKDIESNWQNGVKKLDEFLRSLEFGEAMSAISSLRDYILLKEIFIQKSILDLCWEIHKQLIAARVSADVARRDPRNPDHMTKYQEAIDKLGPAVENLVTKIHNELNPVGSLKK